MKNFLVSILTLLYFSSLTGADVYLKHCLNDLSDSGCKNHTEETCDQYGKGKKGKLGKYCCEQVNKNSNYKTYHLAAVSVHHLQHPVSLAITATNFIIPSRVYSVFTTENPIGSPFNQNKGVAVYIRNCVFLI